MSIFVREDEYLDRIATALEAIAEKLPSKRELAALILYSTNTSEEWYTIEGAVEQADKLLAELAKEKPDA